MNGPLPRHGGQLQAIAKRFGLEASRLIDFSANLNPDGPPASVILAMRHHLQSTNALTTYPDMEELDLRSAIARYTGCDVENIVVGNGFVSLLEAVIRARGLRSCCVPMPAFNEYWRTLERCGAAVVPSVLNPLTNFAYNISDLLSSGCDAILLANPQNPSGVSTERSDLLDLVERAASRGMLVLLDEAFIDYSLGTSLTRDVANHANLVVFRSVTKYFGMPGLRVAYAAVHRTVQPAVAACMAPWSISTPASAGVIAALDDQEFQATVKGQNDKRMALMMEALVQLDVTVYPASANYVLIRLPEKMDARLVWQTLVEKHGVVLRLCEDFEGLPPGHLRIAVKRKEENAIAMQALASVLKAH